MKVNPAGIAGALATCGLLATAAQARPIVLADGLTVMGEYGAETMSEVHAFYAPNFRYSFGVGLLSLNSHVSQPVAAGTGGHGHGGPVVPGQVQAPLEHDITYLRLNYLPLRWNLESAQANVYVWGGPGWMNIDERGDHPVIWNVGGQFDYETRRVYASLRTDLYEADTFEHRIDTVQLGIAPFKHDYDTLAVWFVVQARQYAGETIHEGTEVAGLLRLFKRKTWIEAGVTEDGKVQAMMMFNF